MRTISRSLQVKLWTCITSSTLEVNKTKSVVVVLTTSLCRCSDESCKKLYLPRSALFLLRFLRTGGREVLRKSKTGTGSDMANTNRREKQRLERCSEAVRRDSEINGSRRLWFMGFKSHARDGKNLTPVSEEIPAGARLHARIRPETQDRNGHACAGNC